jgi:hypothetical protein
VSVERMKILLQSQKVIKNLFHLSPTRNFLIYF